MLVMKTNPDRFSLGALLGAGVAALAASICCVLPLLLVLAGIGGAWISNLTALDAWRPWFAAMTILCLAWAFWALYGPASRCQTDGACADPRQLRQRRRWLWIATIGIALLLLFPYYIHWFL
jgi:mercuric ion transport protein